MISLIPCKLRSNLRCSNWLRSHWLSVVIPAVIIILAAALRLYRLGQVPAGFTWDEAAIGYNGFAVIKTRRDEWLQRLPTSFRSFGDYKAPLAIYLNGFFTLLFGLNPVAVRLPFALSGIAAVLGWYLLLRHLLRIASIYIQQGQQSLVRQILQQLPFFGALFLACSPWHLHLTRAGFESGLALTFIIWALWLLLKFLFPLKLSADAAGSPSTIRLDSKQKHNFWQRCRPLLLAVTLLVASLYTYHSSKVFVPLLVILILGLGFKRFYQQWLSTLLGFLWGVLLSTPLIWDAFFGSGLERAGTLVFSLDKSGGEKLLIIIRHLLFHLSPQFLVKGAVSTLRHGPGQFGALLALTYFLCLAAMLILLLSLLGQALQFIARRQAGQSLARLGKLLKVSDNQSQWQLYLHWFIISSTWILLGLLPAALGKMVPQANRALLALPGFLLLALLGIQLLAQYLGKLQQVLVRQWLSSWPNLSQTKLSSRLSQVILAVFLINFAFYLHYYYTNFAQNSADAFQQGYLPAFHLVTDYEYGRHGKPEKQKIVFTSDYGQPYIYALFVRQTNPIWYQGGSLIKYEFKSQVDMGDLSRENAVIVASGQDELPLNKADHVIYGTDGSVRFKIYVK